jgi:hypothetical protein
MVALRPSVCDPERLPVLALLSIACLTADIALVSLPVPAADPLVELVPVLLATADLGLERDLFLLERRLSPELAVDSPNTVAVSLAELGVSVSLESSNSPSGSSMSNERCLWRRLSRLWPYLPGDL